MAHPEITDTPSVPKPKTFKVGEFAKAVFGMFDAGDTRAVTLKCRNKLMKSILDRFGSKTHTEIYDGEHFLAEVSVSVSPVFFGWIVGFGGDMEVHSPRDVRDEYAALLKSLLPNPHK
jgi:predicted DNA-binding transcriptional regulator YafY